MRHSAQETYIVLHKTDDIFKLIFMEMLIFWSWICLNYCLESKKKKYVTDSHFLTTSLECSLINDNFTDINFFPIYRQIGLDIAVLKTKTGVIIIPRYDKAGIMMTAFVAVAEVAGRLSLCYATLHWHDSRAVIGRFPRGRFL